MAKKERPRNFGAVRRLASGRYQARYYGTDGLRRAAPHTFATEKQAQNWLTTVEAEILKGDWAAPEAGEMLLGPYAEKWLKERKLALRTREVYESVYRLNIDSYLAHLSLAGVKPATVRSWRSKLLKDGRPEGQAVKAYRLLRAIFMTAVKEDEILRQNPCRIKGFDAYETPERMPPTLDQVRALAEEMPARYYALILLAAFSGLRWGELAALSRGDMDMEEGKVRVHRQLVSVRGSLQFGPPKSKAGKRTVTLPGQAVDIVRHHLTHNMSSTSEAELLFTGDKGAPLRSTSFRRAVDWPEAVVAAGLPAGFHFHDLRHLGNLLAAEAGASTKELMKRLGQSTVRAALLYQHATEKRDREIADEIDKRIAVAPSEEDEDEDD